MSYRTDPKTSFLFNKDIRIPDKNKNTCKNHNINKDFLRCVCNNNIECIKTLLKSGVDVNYKDEIHGASTLMYSIRYSSLDVLKLLIDSGADVNLSSNDETTALMWAVRWGNIDKTKLLLRCGAKINTQTSLGVTPLIWAVRWGNIDSVEQLLISGANPNVGTKINNSALIWASQNGSIEKVKILIKYGAKANICNKKGLDSLLAAVIQGHTDVVKYLLKYTEVESKNKALIEAVQLGDIKSTLLLLSSGADPDTKDRLRTPVITIATRKNFLNIIKILIIYKADINKRDKDGNTALMEAVRLDLVEAVKIILESGANANLVNRNGESALIIAIRYNSIDIAFLLLEHEAKPDNGLFNKKTALFLATEKGFFIKVGKYLEKRNIMVDYDLRLRLAEQLLLKGANPNTELELEAEGATVRISPLINALESKHVALVKLLLIFGSRINYFSKEGRSAFQLAVETNDCSLIIEFIARGADVNNNTLFVSSNQDVIKLLLDNGADVNYLSHGGRTPLIHALVYHKENLIKTLLEYGANLNTRFSIDCFTDVTPLLYAIEYGKWDLVELFIDYEVDIFTEDVYRILKFTKNGCESYLFKVLQTNNERIISYIISKGIDINIRSANLMRTPIIKAAIFCNLGIVELLLKNGANPNDEDNYGSTPLLEAIRRESLDLVMLLLQYGADVNKVNKYSWTPLLIALSHRKFDIIKILLNYGADVNIKNRDQKTPIMLAATSYDQQKLKLLLDHSIVSINERDEHEKTALLLALEKYKYENALLLIKHGAIICIKSWEILKREHLIEKI